MHVRVLDSQGSGPNASVKLGVDGASAGTKKSTNVGLGVGPSRQPGPTPGQRWQSDTPPAPRRVLSEPATPPKPEAQTLSRTSSGVRVIQVTQATPSPSRPIMGPVITPVRQTPHTPGSASASGSSQKPSCVPVLLPETFL